MNTSTDRVGRLAKTAMWLVAGAGLLALAACATTYSGLHVSGAHREEIVSRYLGHELVLASSLRTGEFFGDASRRFADARPADIIDLRDAHGESIAVPPLNDAVVVAGTPVRITGIWFPGDGARDAQSNQAGAMPTAHTWVVAEPIAEADERPLVLLLARDINGPDALVKELNARFASPEWALTWLSRRDAAIAAHIRHKTLAPGMSTAEMVAAAGEPRNAKVLTAFGIADLVADYGNLHVKVQGGVIAGISNDNLEPQQAAARARERERRFDQRRAEQLRALTAAAAIHREQEALAGELAEKKAAIERNKQERAAARHRAREERVAAERRAVERLVDDKRAAVETEIAELEEAKRWVDSELRPVLARAEADLDGIIETEAGTPNYTRKLGIAESLVLKARTDLSDQLSEFDERIEAANWRLCALDGKVYGIHLETLSATGRSRRGARVIAVDEGPAEAAGIRRDDIIIRFNYRPVRGPADFAKRVSEWPANRAAHVELLRGRTRIRIALEPLREPIVASRQASWRAKTRPGS